MTEDLIMIGSALGLELRDLEGTPTNGLVRKLERAATALRSDLEEARQEVGRYRTELANRGIHLEAGGTIVEVQSFQSGGDKTPG